MAIRVYSSLDTGAPALTGSDFNRLKQIVLACLVTGYGSKAGAGWSIGHESTDGKGFSVGNGEGFANFVDASGGYAAAYIMENVTNGATALADGYNRRSGPWFDGAVTTERNRHYLGGLSLSYAHWLVVADERTAHVSIGGNFSTAEFPTWYSAVFSFGAYINPLGLSGFAFIGGQEGTSGQAFIGRQGTAGMVTRNPLTGLVEQGALPRYTGCPAVFNREITPAQRQVLLPGRLMPVRAGLVGWGAGLSGSSAASGWVTLGYLRGMVSEPTLSAARLGQVLPLFGKTNVWQSRIQPLALPGDRTWYPLYSFNNDDGFFISLDPTDWE